MRVASLVVLLAAAGTVAYLFINSNTRNWILGQTEEATFQTQGYSLAKTPLQAMEKFLEAIKEKNYKAAARYCLGDYSDQLKKAHAAASSIDAELDRIGNKIDDKGYRTDKVTQVIWGMRAFPKQFKIKEQPKETGDKAIGRYELEPMPFPQNSLQWNEISALDHKFWNVYPLRPGNLFQNVEIKKENDVWKIDFFMATGQQQAIAYYIDKHKGYVTGLKQFRDDLNRDTFLKDRVPGALIDILVSNK